MIENVFFRSMVPLYPPDLYENGAVVTLNPVHICSKIESRLDTIFVPGTKISLYMVQYFPRQCSEIPGTIFGAKELKFFLRLDYQTTNPWLSEFAFR